VSRTRRGCTAGAPRRRGSERGSLACSPLGRSMQTDHGRSPCSRKRASTTGDRRHDRAVEPPALCVPRRGTPSGVAPPPGDDVVPIPGSRSPAHIDENLAAARIRLSPEVLERIDDLARRTPAGLASHAPSEPRLAPKIEPSRRAIVLGLTLDTARRAMARVPILCLRRLCPAAQLAAPHFREVIDRRGPAGVCKRPAGCSSAGL
jgi:hypothetical protein